MADHIIALMCPEAGSGRGAPLGRARRGGGETGATGPFYLRKIPLTQGYDPGGAYWGMGVPLYGYINGEGTISGFLRAPSRTEAINTLREWYPAAKLVGSK